MLHFKYFFKFNIELFEIGYLMNDFTPLPFFSLLLIFILFILYKVQTFIEQMIRV